jgi:hypothetical protein
MTDRNTRYEALVSADSAEEAIGIAAEALPKQSVLATSTAWDASAEHGPGSWMVRLTYKAGPKPEDLSN